MLNRVADGGFVLQDSDPQGRPRRTDQLFIRAETCMFMVKLPQYSTQEVMRERLLTAVTYRGDPLNG
jgi:E3 ubiquitin-protein ligase HECTD4